ncbi:MAG: hypothetical protein K8R74_08575, partial [Bacteroidales bacterium]|nr:hypothetical protein [Bacteroidales bacterium]
MKTHLRKFQILFTILFAAIFPSCNVSGQATLKKVERFKTGIFYGLSVKENNAYTTTNTSLIILDIQNPEKLVKISELIIGVPVFSLSVVDNYAFLAASSKGLVIVDISDSKKTQIIGQYNGDGDVSGVKVIGDYCYLLDYKNNFQIIDISKPSKPFKIGSYKILGRDLLIKEEFAFISDPSNGLTILDISDPENIKKVSVINNTKGAAGMSVDGEFLFLGSFNNWVQVFNISNLISPKFITSYT